MPTDLITWAHNPFARAWMANAEPPAAVSFHRSLPGYAPTPLVAAPQLAAELGVANVWVKDESNRFGLPSFKILGASWATNRIISAQAGCLSPAATLIELRKRAAGRDFTLVAATDGNHGRALARMAKLLDVRARIYVPAGLGRAATEAIEGEGAHVIGTDLIYDDVVRFAAESIANSDELLTQDTSWPGYEEVPQWVVDGYSTLFTEIDDQLTGECDLIAVPAGVGSLLQSALEHYRSPGSAASAVLAVEPASAACVTASLHTGRPVSVSTAMPTIMVGLNCGTVSTIAWSAILRGLTASAVVSEDQARDAVRTLSALGILSGPCGAASLAGVRVALEQPRRRAALGIDSSSSVVLISTESLAANPIPPLLSGFDTIEP